MTKLIAAYLADPSIKNAKKIRAYSYAHGFAACFLSDADRGVVLGAILQANQG